MKTRTLWLNVILLLALLLTGVSYPIVAALPETGGVPALQAILSEDEPKILATPTTLLQTPEWTWQNPLPQGNMLRAVWGSGPNDVFAVGAAGTILHFDGSQWSIMNSGTTEWLGGVWGSSSSDVFVVGDCGVLHYDGDVWHTMDSGISYRLNGVWGSSESDVFVVGQGGTIYHYDGNMWTEMESGITLTYNLNGVWGTSPNNVFAVSNHWDSDGIILHYNGQYWSQMKSVTDRYLYGVWGSGPNDIFVVGSYGTIMRYDGSRWSMMDSGTTNALRSVWGSGPNDVFAVGELGTIRHYDGEQWTAMLGFWGLYGVWGSSGSDVFAVGGESGAFTSTSIRHYNGSEWREMRSGSTTNLNGIWGNDSDVFVVGDDGAIWRYKDDVWYHGSLAIHHLYAVWGSSSSDVFAVGYDGTIQHYNGILWTGMDSHQPAVYLRGIWGNSNENVFVVGSQGTILHYDGSEWNMMNSGITSSLYSVWGNSGDDVFAVGYGGIILHYDGNAWYTVANGTAQLLQSVWGSSSDNVFAVGWGGAILHYDGSTWSSMSSGTTRNLYGVWGSGSNDVFAVGEGGTILHYDDNAWRMMNSGTNNMLNGVWGNGPNDVFAVGSGGTILHYGRDPEGTINGRVSSTIGDTGLSDVVVTARTYSTTTDLNGDYTLVVSPGVYSVKATPNAGMDYYANQRSFITVDDGETVTVDLKLTPITSDTANTLILTNLQRMKDIGFDGTTVDELEAKLSELKATHPDRTNMTAAFVDFGAGVSPDIDAAYAAWNGNEGDVLKTNALVDSIDAYIENLKLNDYPNLKYLIIVGSHEVIPMKARAADSREENEWAENALPLKAAYLYEIYRSTENGASGFYFTDSQYGDLSYVRNFLGYGSDDELVPELAVGRLVETPRQIADLVDVYINANGSLSAENMLVVTSRDYLDSGSLVARYMGSGADTELIQDQFLSQLIPPKLEANHDIVYMGMHGNYYLMETYKGESAFVAGVSESQGSIDDISGDLTNAVIAASGCHVGVNLGNQLYHAPEATSTTWSDFPEEFAKKKVGVYIASTGYSIISRGSPPIKSESLMANFLRGLLHEPDYTVGDAYKAAVRDYVKWLWPWWDPDDRRVLAVATLYGIPNYRLSVTPSSPAADYTGINGGSEPTWSALLRAGAGLESIDISITDWDLSDEGIVTLPHVSYLSSIGNPLLPVITIEKVVPTGTGVLGITWDVEGSSYIDVENQVPLSEVVTLDSNGEVISETGTFTHTGFFPATMVFTRTMAIGDEGTSLNLQIMPVQYDQGTHTTRVWTHLSFDVEYDVAASIDSDGDGLPDYWEKAYGLDPLNDSGDNGPDGDIDGDGLSNIAEYHYTTNPRKADTDDDGSPDRIEILLGTDPNNPFSRAKIIFLPLVTRS